MVLPAAQSHRPLVQGTQAGNGFSGIQNDGGGTRHGLNETTSEGGNPGHPLQKIQGDTLTAEQRLSWPLHRGYNLTGHHRVAIIDPAGQFDPFIELGQGPAYNFQTGDNTSLFGNELPG